MSVIVVFLRPLGLRLLTSIATRFYGAGTPDNVNKIYFSNQSTVGPNPNLIYAGQKLYIPD